ncbi:MAG TPA: tyrosinase family protein [Prosthecobacter sp.]
MKRREFIHYGMGTIAAVAYSQTPSTTQLRVRQSALKLQANDPLFGKYAEAVKRMHALPATDKRNWLNQAKIHADHCPHGTAGFLPWHRQYILYFEKICGELIGDPQFALPYWDWTEKSGIIPDAFFDVPELNVTHWNDPGTYESEGWGPVDSISIRALAKGVGVQNDPLRGGVFSTPAINSILNETAFERFYRRLEGSPHNGGHVAVGFPPTGKPGHMGSGLSPLDPLFWLHHCNVDRLWAQWQMARNRTPSFNLTYDGNFADAQGNPVNVTADGSVDFVSLGYTYDFLGIPNVLASAAGLIPHSAPGAGSPFALMAPGAPSNQPTVIGTGTSDAPVTIALEKKVTITVSGLKEELTKNRTVLDSTLPPLQEATRLAQFEKSMVAGFGKEQKLPRRILAKIKGVEASAFQQDPVINVFVNCPYLSPTTPYTDPHYAGTFSLFGAAKAAGGQNHDHAHNEPTDYYVDITNAVRGLDQDKLDKLDIQFMTLTGNVNEPGPGSFTFGAVEILST